MLFLAVGVLVTAIGSLDPRRPGLPRYAAIVLRRSIRDAAAREQTVERAAGVAMQRWLSSFDDRIVISSLYFLGVSLLALGIAAAAVIGQSWRVARSEPARALQHE